MTWTDRPNLNPGRYPTGTELETVLDRIEALSNETSVSAAAITSGSPDSTASDTYVNLAGTGSQVSGTFTKLSTTTRLFVQVYATWFSNNANTGAEFGLSINATTTTLGRLGATITANVHYPSLGFGHIPAVSVPAGAYTFNFQWRRAGATPSGTLSRDGQDWFAYLIRECG